MTWTRKDSTGKDNWFIKAQRATTGKRCVVCGGPLKIWMRQKLYCSRECRLKKARERYALKKFNV